MDVNNLGTRITKYRTAHKMSQIELARELKVSQSTLNFWESGRCLPTGENLKKLEAILSKPDPHTHIKSLQTEISDLKITVDFLKDKLRRLGG